MNFEDVFLFSIHYHTILFSAGSFVPGLCGTHTSGTMRRNFTKCGKEKLHSQQIIGEIPSSFICENNKQKMS